VRGRILKVALAAAGIGLAASAVIPTVAAGNARTGDGSEASAATTATPLVASLDQAHVVPAYTPELGVRAVIAITIDSTTNELCYDVVQDAGHSSGWLGGGINEAPAGQNGPVVWPFVTFPEFPDGRVPNPVGHACLSIDPSVAARLLADPAGFYVTFGAYHGPEIRGQLSRGVAPAGSAHLLPTPLRAYDSRLADGPLVPGVTRTLSLLRGVDGGGNAQLAVPPGSTGAIVTVTVTETVAGGYVKLYSAAAPEPATSSINWSTSGQNLAVSTSVAVDAQGRVSATGGVNPTQVVVDVIGYYF
jgi:hypothetical protein